MRPFRISDAVGDSAEEIVVNGEPTVPADVASSDAVALLRSVFGEPPYDVHLRCLRIMLKSLGDETSVADMSRLLQPLSPTQLHGIAALLRRELPPGKWNAAIRGSKVIGMLARLCSAIFGASVAATAPLGAEGRGDGGGGGFSGAEGRPSPPGDVGDMPRRSVPPSPAPSLAGRGSRHGGESTRDIAVRHEAARKVQRQRARLWSRFPGIHRLAVARGIFPAEAAGVLDLDIEILLGFLESIEAETLAIDLLAKSTTTSGMGTSLSTNKAMEVIGDPDSAFEGMLRRGEVTLSELAPYERFFSLPPFAAWVARACSKYFISEMSTLAQAMLEYVRSSLTFLSPSGSLSIHAAHIALSKFRTQCDDRGRPLRLDGRRA